MKKIANWLLSAAATAALLSQGTASAQQPAAMPATPPMQSYGSAPSCCVPTCCTSDCCEHKCGGLVAGVELLWIKPFVHYENSQTVDDSGSNGGSTTDNRPGPLVPNGPSDHMDLSPRFTLGWVSGDGLGARVRYWFFDTAAGFGATYPSNNTGTFTFTDRRNFQFDTVDLEAFKEFTFANTLLTVSGGVRYGNETTKYSRDIVGGSDRNGTPDEILINSKVNFHGWGPTLSLEISHGLRDSGFRVYGNLRGSLLFGSTNVYLNSFDVLAATNFPGVNRQSDDVVPILEGSAGIEWARCSGSAEFFVRLGVEAQVWIEATAGSIPIPQGEDANAPGAANFQKFTADRFTANDTVGVVGLVLGFGIRR
ncbi:hypothetical protein AYO44_09710 [Planctomycetaceae bacterium SCGC AG-212-F19]|nr:hypothetical protein AYO44_09710 [Planctomycetaceae bacterium SCGC AG-212-F19]